MQGNGAVLQLGSVGVDSSNYAMVAEAVISQKSSTGSRELKSDFRQLTTTKIRGIYGLITNVYTRVNCKEDLETNISDLQYIKVKMAYESGRDVRDGSVREFISRSGLMRMLDQIKTYDQFVLYCRYAESLVAYFKFYGGEE